VILNEVISGGVHYAFDTTGRNDILKEALKGLRMLGKCILVAASAAPNIEIDSAVF